MFVLSWLYPDRILVICLAKFYMAASLALWQLHKCPIVSEVTLKDKGKNNLNELIPCHDKTWLQTMYIIIGKYCTSDGCLPLILCWVIYSAENASLDPSQSWPVVNYMQAEQSPPYPSFCDLHPCPSFCDLHRMLAVVIRCHCPGKGTGSVSVLWYSEKVMSICQVKLFVGHVSLWWLWWFLSVLQWCFVC